MCNNKLNLPKIEMVFDSIQKLQSEFETNLKNGGTFLPYAISLQELDQCYIELIHPHTQDHLAIHAKVVWLAPDNKGAGFAFIGFGPAQRETIATFINKTVLNPTETDTTRKSSEPQCDAAEAPILESVPNQETQNQSIHERLRNLPVAEQLRVARGGNANERIALERIYGKSVWEALLRNNKLTVPEVARIAKMGALPKPLVDILVCNPSWVSSPPVRRALLTNPKLGREQIAKVLKAMPQPELRLVPKQTAYTAAVRETARRLLRRL